MPILKRPGIYYDENVDYELIGQGSKIPVIIGISGNTTQDDYTVDGTQIKKYNSWDEANLPTTQGGVGEYSEDTNNQLSIFLKEFFQEARVKTPEEIFTPYLYVIDVGTGESENAWINAATLAKTKRDATIEAYLGLEEVNGTTLMELTKKLQKNILKETHGLNLRNMFVRLPTNKVFGEDEELGLTDYTNNTNQLTLKRCGLCEKHLFGKTIAMICCTPYYREPGFYTYRSVSEGEFIERTASEEQALQDAGIIFNHDEQPGLEIYPKMNLCLCSTAALNKRPADSLFHARFNADHLLNEIFITLYPQLKDNESTANINYLQTQIDNIIRNEVKAGYMIKHNKVTGEGTFLTLTESEYNPYDMLCSGQIQPVNSTIAIDVEATLTLNKSSGVYGIKGYLKPPELFINIYGEQYDDEIHAKQFFIVSVLDEKLEYGLYDYQELYDNLKLRIYNSESEEIEIPYEFNVYNNAVVFTVPFDTDEGLDEGEYVVNVYSPPTDVYRELSQSFVINVLEEIVVVEDEHEEDEVGNLEPEIIIEEP